MKDEVAKLLVEAGSAIGVELSLYEGYSGRGMFGDKTAGIVYDNDSDLYQSIAWAAASLARDEQETQYKTEQEGAIIVEDETKVDVDTFVDEMRKLRGDSMGRSAIVY